jgi:hypothetical protein
MSLGIAPGGPDYSTASGASNFIPEIWSTKLQVKFYKATVLTAISNTDYEGEIKDVGDKVIIRTTPDVAIKDYYKGMDLTYENLESAPLELLIDKGKYFAFKIDDVDAYQSDIKLMNRWSEDASNQMKIAVDTLVLADFKAACATANLGASGGSGAISSTVSLGYATAPYQITKTNVIEYIVGCGQVLDESDIPEGGRFMVIPAWFAARLKVSDLKDASMTGDGTSAMRNGRLGVIDRFTLYSSNCLPITSDTVNCWDIPFGTKYGLTFASQITKTESLRAERTFGNLVRGLNVFGYEMVKPEAVGCGYVRP